MIGVYGLKESLPTVYLPPKAPLVIKGFVHLHLRLIHLLFPHLFAQICNHSYPDFLRVYEEFNAFEGCEHRNIFVVTLYRTMKL